MIIPSSSLVIITGLPSTGKTTLGRRLSADLGLPFLHKDGIKERLFDTLGWQDREWSRRLGQATYELMFYFLEMMLQTGTALIVESNFKAEMHSAPLRWLLERYAYGAVQILCWSQGERLLERFEKRQNSGERHPGHVDQLALSDLRETLRQGRQAPLDLPGTLIEVETTDFSQIDYPALRAELLAYLNQPAQLGGHRRGDLP